MKWLLCMHIPVVNHSGRNNGFGNPLANCTMCGMLFPCLLSFQGHPPAILFALSVVTYTHTWREWKTDLQAYKLHYLPFPPPLPPAPPFSVSNSSFLPFFSSLLFPASPNPLLPNRDVSRELSSFGKKEWQLPQREYMCGGRAVPGESSWGNPLCPCHRDSDSDNDIHDYITSCVCLTKQCMMSMCYVNC